MGRYLTSLCLFMAPSLLLITVSSPTPEAAKVVTAFAGAGPRGFFGDGGPATAALLWSPKGLVFDPQGNLYIADAWNHRVRRVSPAGLISTVAGSGPVGANEGAYAGDGGPALRARLHWPEAVAVDGRGNLFVVDRGNSQVRRFTIDGPISTVAGTGESGFSGDGGAATKAKLSDPMGLAVDRNGNLWIAEVGRVRRIDADGIITTVAGGGTKEPADGLSATSVRLRLPHSLAVDDAGNLYVAEQRRPRVYKVNPKGLITVVAGTGESGFSGDGGPATKARLKVPYALTVDRAGNLYIAEAGLNRTVLLDGTPVLAEGGRVRRVSPDGTITTVVGGGAGVLMLGGPAVPAAIDPRGLAIDTAGNLLIAIIGSRIVKVAGVAAPGLLPKKAEPAESADSGDPNATETGERSQAPTEERR